MFEGIASFLGGPDAAGLCHDQLEERLSAEGRELCRQLLQDHFDLRAEREQRSAAVRDATDVRHSTIEAGHRRLLETVFGAVKVTRFAYRAKGHENLHLQDAALNLPKERYSHGLRQLAAVEAARGSYEETQGAVERACGVGLPKRQTEQLAARASVDFEAFYRSEPRPDVDDGHVVVISADGKGVIMRPDALRPATAAAAARSHNKLHGRLSKGEKSNRKRMAEVATVYTVAPVVRSPGDVMAHHNQVPAGKQAPNAERKWAAASVVDDAATVISRAFDEAERRDPDKRRPWVALLDGNCHQIDRVRAEAHKRGVKITVICDFVHVLQYLWSAAWSFFDEGDPDAEEWVHAKAIDVLSGKASIVAAAIRRKATTLRLDQKTRHNADTCADYLLAKAPHLDYPEALAKGLPIATGVVEGCCRYIVKDRMDITGARWGLQGAEAVLKLRALRANGDWDRYWTFHLTREHTRVHQSRYLHGAIPKAA